MTITTKRRPVLAAADAMREKVFAVDAGERIGSLKDLARELAVGIVTLQQAARILEHEGLLEVRRGPGGGYFGRRPNSETLERALSAYLRSVSESREEILQITSLLFNELCAEAARCAEDSQFYELSQLRADISRSTIEQELGARQGRGAGRRLRDPDVLANLQMKGEGRLTPRAFSEKWEPVFGRKML